MTAGVIAYRLPFDPNDGLDDIAGLEDTAMTHRHCTFSGCAKTVDLPDVILLPPEGWVWLEGPGAPEGLYCEPHAEQAQRLGRAALGRKAGHRRRR